MAIKYLSIQQFAERAGVTRGTIIGYNLPIPDAYIGKTRGWLPQTVDEWIANRPGRGATEKGWYLQKELADLAPEQAKRGRKPKPKPTEAETPKTTDNA